MQYWIKPLWSFDSDALSPGLIPYYGNHIMIALLFWVGLWLGHIYIPALSEPADMTPADVTPPERLDCGA